jgi:ubiquinone/menaquinone biosynthesis C-methylase UbiE
MPDFSNFLEVQTRTPWGRTLADFAAFCAPRPDSVLLDVGCGPGLLPLLLAQSGSRSLGVDLDLGLLAARLAPNLAQADALRLPFPAEAFDLVTASNLLFLLDDPAAALREWARVLRPGGSLCLLNPSERLNLATAGTIVQERKLEGAARDSLLGWAANAEAHVRWTEGETGALFAEAGLALAESTLRVGPGFARFSRGIQSAIH